MYYQTNKLYTIIKKIYTNYFEIYADRRTIMCTFIKREMGNLVWEIYMPLRNNVSCGYDGSLSS